MTRKGLQKLATAADWTCLRCQRRRRNPSRDTFLLPRVSRQSFSTSRSSGADMEIVAAPKIDLANPAFAQAARLIPQSPSYFTTTPVFNDYILKTQKLLREHGSLPMLPPAQAPRIVWMTLGQFRGTAGEKVSASKYAALVVQLRRLNLIHPQLRPAEVRQLLERFRRPGAPEAIKSKPQKIDEYGRAKGIGRRKAAKAKVLLVEGTGEVLVNGRSLHESFPRIHDRESALWPLRVTNRMDKYNVFVLASGGGLTGQAESITLGLAKALIVQEPALKPALRKAGTVTRIMKRVERKKTGRVKARKRPTWVKR